MFHLRRTAFRLLANPSTSFVCRSRSITSISHPSFRSTRPTSFAPTFQRRWASEDTSKELKSESQDSSEETPIEKVEAVPEDEIENAIQSESAKDTVEKGEDTQSTFDTAKEKIGNVIESATETAQAAASSAGQALSGEAPKTGEIAALYVGNLFFDVSDNDLEKEFSRFGHIQSVKVIRDPRGFSKGFGYVNFYSKEDADKARETMNQTIFEGRRIAVQASVAQIPRPSKKPWDAENPPSKTLFIGNMSFEMTDRDLNDLFKGIRNVIDVRVAIDRRTGQPRGFAHADFIDVASAVEAHKILREKDTYGRKLRIDFSHNQKSVGGGQGHGNQ